ncbi:amidase [Spirochaeta isovalerica]|uniref:Amidase n=1 Tax=Spirochaeta isovalerica TaxID=150 RepID=A0A841RFV6_9SPIO|nr:amidase [Spirochaeta isovalerica]MBB6482271.1 amidase [Spirochaeta isovalerica]
MDKLKDATIESLQDLMDKGELKAEDLVRYYLERIETYDRKGPELNSVLEINPDSLEMARSLDKERKEKGRRSPLHGIPVMLKGNIDTGDKMETTAGSLALAGHKAAGDAFLAEQLRKAGAVILGKTNLSEWANFRSSRSSSGWSSRGGQTRNPYDRERSPCGSSSGSGVAVAADFTTVAVGTETDGSIVCPSQKNGIVGFKPTIGLVSRSGIIPIAHSQDTAGPMARTVSDAVYLLDAMKGSDSRDESTRPFGVKGEKDYASFLKSGALKGARIGLVKSFCGFRSDIDEMVAEAAEQMRQAGAQIIEDLELPHMREYDDEEMEVLLYEFKADLNAYLSGAGAPVKNLEELIDFNRKRSGETMPWFGQELLIKAQEKGDLTEETYKKAREKSLRLAGEEGIDSLLKEHQLQALIGPTGGPAWKIDLINGDHYTGGGASQAAAIAGYPHITVPMGFVHGLPVGLSFIGTAWSEPVLIGLAYSWEQISRKRRPPEM